MSIHSVDDFEPTSSAPVFGSAVSQTKIQQQQQPNNDLGGAEKLVTPPQPVVNGQNDTTNNKNSDNLGNGTTESVNGNTGTNGSTDVHVNGQTAVDTLPPINTTTQDDVNPTEEAISSSEAPEPIEKSSQNDSLPAPSNEPTGSVSPIATPSIDAPVPTEPKPALSPSADVAKEDLSSVPSTNIDNAAPPPPVETTSTPTPTPTLNDNVPTSAPAPEATVSAESFATPERKSKSPRVKAKSPAVSAPPTRQSTRSRKPVLSSSLNEDETDDVEASTTTSQPESSSSPKRTKRQAATKATDAIQASNEPTSTSDGTVTEEVNDPTDHDAIPSDVEEDDYDVKESKTKKKTPSPRKGARASTSGGRKRGASSSPSVSASKKKKASPKGKQSTTLNDEQPIEVENSEATTAESETVQTPPKKARTSGNKKTPTSTTPTPEYVRKLRPRK